jgi:CO/xanthine dehydrogenase Mo-binding subunit
MCRIRKDGSVEVRNGAQDIGTGTRTIMAMVAAEELGLPLAGVTAFLGDTNDPIGPGSGGSTTAPTIMPAVRQAAPSERAALFLVDAAQTAGVIPIDVQAECIDLLAFPGHKSLFGPTGTGALYVGSRANLRPWREGGTAVGALMATNLFRASQVYVVTLPFASLFEVRFPFSS